MQECINETRKTTESLVDLRQRIEEIRNYPQHVYRKSFFKRYREEYRSFNLAVTQALAIVDSIEARFIVGQGDSEPRPLRNSTWWLYEDENLFE